MVVKVRSQVLIEAEPSVVFGVLQDLEKFEQWNPLLVKGSGKFQVNSKINLTLFNGMEFTPNVLVVEQDKEIRWIGKGPLPCMFDGEHHFILERQDSGHTLLHHGEDFTGCMPPLLPKLMRDTRENFVKANTALKARCENM